MKVKEEFFCIEQRKPFKPGDDYTASKERIAHLQNLGKLERSKSKNAKPKTENKNAAPKTEDKKK